MLYYIFQFIFLSRLLFLDISFFYSPLKNSKKKNLCRTAKKISSKAIGYFAQRLKRKKSFQAKTSSLIEIGKKFVAETFKRTQFKHTTRTVMDFFARLSEIGQIFKVKRNSFLKCHFTS